MDGHRPVFLTRVGRGAPQHPLSSRHKTARRRQNSAHLSTLPIAQPEPGTERHAPTARENRWSGPNSQLGLHVDSGDLSGGVEALMTKSYELLIVVWRNWSRSTTPCIPGRKRSLACGPSLVPIE